MNHIITYFHLEKVEEVNSYGVPGNNLNKNEYYFRCILNFFYSSLYYNKGAKHYLICNETDNIEFIDNIEFKKFILDNDIELINIESKYVKKNRKWAGSMYLFDAIEYFSDKSIDNDNYMFFDNDILIHHNLDDCNILSKNFDCILYDITHEYKKDDKWLINYNDIDSIYTKDTEFIPIGGEFLAIKGKYINKFINKFKSIKDKRGLLTEEHFLSFMSAYKLFDCEKILIKDTDLIRRIWTTFKYNNVQTSDIQLKILHLPSEKMYGLKWLSDYIIKKIKNNSEYNKNIALVYTGIIKKPNIYVKKFTISILYKVKNLLNIKKYI